MKKLSFIIFAALVVLVSCSKNDPTSSPEGQETSVVTDLSATGTANCYVVPAVGIYKFKATVKGNSTESVGTPVSADVLWESFGTDVKPSKGAIINNVSFQDGYVKFYTSKILANGNAVIAVRSNTGRILWSWHIWVCKDFYPSASAQVYNNNAGTMMDRNLGATSVTPGDVKALGLFYQWGRKDPFLASSSISSNKIAASSLPVWPSAVTSDKSTGTIAYAVANPTTFITRNSDNGDWYYTGSAATDDTRWQTSDKTKGVHDPCPVGWRVPDGGESGVWFTALGTSTHYDNYFWDDANLGSDLGSGHASDSYLQIGSAKSIWYPAAGAYFSNDAELALVGYWGEYWSCTPGVDEGFAAYDFQFEDKLYGYLYPYLKSYRAYGFSVRCILDCFQ